MDDIEPTQKDFLTGFYTREHLVSTLIKKIIDANLHHEKFSILLIDIDHFKKINDKYGHLWGDEFLKYVASTLRLTLEDKGLIFRYGGDEFVVLFSTPDPKQAYILARQFNLVMRNRPFLFNGKLFKITISCGLATYPDDAEGAERLLQKADEALYLSKKYGRNVTTRASGMKIQRLKMFTLISLKVLFFVVVLLSINAYLFRGRLKNLFNKVSIRKMLPFGTKADTTIVLKSGDVVLGRIITEDENKLVVGLSVGQGSCTMNIEKSLVHSIVHHNKEQKE